MEIQELQVGMRRRFPPAVYGVCGASWKSILGKPPATGTGKPASNPGCQVKNCRAGPSESALNPQKANCLYSNRSNMLEWYITLCK